MAESESKTYTAEEVAAIIAERDAIKANRDEALTEAKKAKKALQNYEGVDPAEFKRLKDAAEQAEANKARAEGDFETLKKQLVEKHNAELTGKESKIGKLTKALERRLVDAELTRAIAAKKGEPDLLLPYARQFVRVKETEDDFEGYVSDAAGNPLIADGKGTPMSFETFVEQTLMTKFPRAFDGTGSSGGGAAKTNAGGGGQNTFNPATATPADFLNSVEALSKGTVKLPA